MTFEQLKERLKNLKYYPGGYIDFDGNYITGRYTMFYGDLVQFKEGEGFEVRHDWIASTDSNFEEFEFPDSVWEIEGFDGDEYGETIMAFLTNEREVSNPNDWEQQK